MTDYIKNGDDDHPTEVTICLENGGKLELMDVEVDADRNPISFTVTGLIHDVETTVLNAIQGKSLTPKAVQFEVSDT